MKKAIVLAALVLAACGQGPSSDIAGRWDVQQIAGASLGEGVDVWIEVSADGRSLSGFTGCNNFTAPLSGFGNSVTVGPIAEEVGECPSSAASTDEERFLMVLPAIRRKILHGDSLELSDATPGVDALLRLRRVETAGG
jgi:heat shock protein HslJ